MKPTTIEEYRKEIERVEEAIKKTTSHFQRRDYWKYLKRLQGELGYALANSTRAPRRKECKKG